MVLSGSMQCVNDVGVKEWGVICRELGEGRQFIVLRKGGIREPARGFNVEHSEFFLFPTYVHQNEDELIDAARAGLPEVARSAPPGGLLHLDLYARVAAGVGSPALQPTRP